MAFTYNKRDVKELVNPDENFTPRVYVREHAEEIREEYRKALSVNWILNNSYLFSDDNRPVYKVGDYTTVGKMEKYTGKVVPRSKFRHYIEELLIDSGEYVSHAEATTNAFHRTREKWRKERGIINPAQIKNDNGTYGNGYCKRNNLELERSTMNTEYKEYRDKVDKLTRRNVEKLIRGTFPGKPDFVLPKYCEYTGIRFCDADINEVNPNNITKRSKDHKKPILLCFLEGITVEDAAHPDNIAFVLKYCNESKGNASDTDFRARHSPLIRKRLISEGFEHN